MLSLLTALALHAGATLFGSCNRRDASAFAGLEVASIAEISIETRAVGVGGLPGGGSPAPDPAGKEQASSKQPEIVKPKAIAVPHAAIVRDRARIAETAPEKPEEGAPTEEPDLLAAKELDSFTVERVRPHAVRAENARRASATALDAASQSPSTSVSRGEGPGAGEGPGGRGRGYGTGGVITKQFAFGGPTGAFRAEVCFIPNTVKSLNQIGDCQPVATFFTNVLNVPPRPFTEGFPGISQRFEWFSIRYRGKFTVAAADYYRFRLLSDDGAILYIDGYRIIDNDGGHAPRSLQMTIPLDEGEHDVRVDYYQGPRENIALQLFVKASSGVEHLFGPEL